MAAKRQQAEREPTAAQRLATAQEGLRRLRVENVAADAHKQAAQAQLDELSEKLAALQRAQDIRGEDVAAALLSVTAQRTEAARQVSIASATRGELAQRAAAVNRALPALEAAALQDELAAAAASGTEAARRYRAALEGFLAAAVVLQSDLAKCRRLGESITAKGAEPRARLLTPLLPGADVDRILAVARNTGGDAGAVAGAIAGLFDRWQL